MKLSPALAAIFLAIPSLVAAAPTATPAGAVELSTPVTANIVAFPREATCNAPIPTDPDDLEKYNEEMRKMSEATVKAHTGERMCKPADFISSKNKQVKERVKKACVEGYEM